MSLTSNLTASTSTSTSTPTQQKRVLPTRTRRAGAQTGVGGHEIDLLILEEYKRPSIPEPIIPADTPFILAYESSDLVGDGDTEVTEDTSFFDVGTFDSYFGRESVKESFRERLDIETPEYYESTNPVVSGRFRPRKSDHVTLENTTDPAYEKRHNKFERFERQLRLREKEKLKHDQHKLLARLEQLRSLDPSAFMALPSSDFPLPHNTSSDGLDATPTELPGVHVNGAAVHAEGLRRRKLMLDVGARLEERYKILLPPDRKSYKASRNASSSASVSVEPEAPSSRPPAARAVRRSRKSTDTISISSAPRASLGREDADVDMDQDQGDRMGDIEEQKPPPPLQKLTIRVPKAETSSSKGKGKQPPAKKRKVTKDAMAIPSPPPSARIIRIQPQLATDPSDPVTVPTSPLTPPEELPFTPKKRTPQKQPPKKASPKKETTHEKEAAKERTPSPMLPQPEFSLVPAIATLEEHEAPSSPMDTIMDEDEDNVDHLATPPPQPAVEVSNTGQKSKGKGKATSRGPQKRSVPHLAAHESVSAPIPSQKQKYFSHSGLSGKKQVCHIRVQAQRDANGTKREAARRGTKPFGAPAPGIINRFEDYDLQLAEDPDISPLLREREGRYTGSDVVMS